MLAVFADVGDIPINWRRHLLANEIRLFGITNHPPTGYPSRLRLLNRFKTTYALEKFVTHELPADQVDKAMAQAFDIDSCVKVVLTPSGGRRRGSVRQLSALSFIPQQFGRFQINKVDLLF